jgi:phosphonate transport system substrate-binding protein
MEGKMKKNLLLMLIAALALLLGACAQERVEESPEASGATVEASEDVADLPVLKIGAIPDQNASKLNKRFDELAAYVSEQTGLEVEYVPTVDYAALVTAFERGDIDLGWFGGLTGVQVRNAVAGAEAIAQRPRDEQFHSVFVAQKALGLTSLEEAAGKTLTFGSESSTSGHLMPRHYLIEAGIDPTADLEGAANFSGSHDKTWKLVESGAFEVGALNEAVWEAATEEGKVDLSKVDVFYTTPAYYDYNWTINTVDEKFGEGTKTAVKEALLSFGEANPEVMDLFKDDKFIETNNDNYSAIESVAKALGIIN